MSILIDWIFPFEMCPRPIESPAAFEVRPTLIGWDRDVLDFSAETICEKPSQMSHCIHDMAAGQGSLIKWERGPVSQSTHKIIAIKAEILIMRDRQ